MIDLEQSSDERELLRKRYGRAIWALVVVLVLIVLILTPPLLNVNRLRRRIATSMSDSLGRPVHMDSVTLQVLPVPGFTLQNLVVSEDPAFGSEPVIRANSVRATVRVSSLWRRQVEFATIRFDEPSVNLVRRADGRWNIESILLHAAQEDAAPTAQRKAGAAPRFPYIEATGARLNVKMGNEKMPLALTEADFALWLPSPQEWHVRIEAKPARTDTNASDTGLMSMEGTLQRAARVEDVPIEMTAAWRNAPLGEATRVLTGSDAGWRGSVDATATLRGTLGDAVANGTLRLNNLRRAEFIPAKMLDVNMECAGHFSIAVAVLREPTCTVSPLPISRIGFGAVEKAPESAVYMNADKVELTGLKATGVRVGTPGVSLGWVMDFVRVWTQRVPATVAPKGSANGSFVLVEAKKGRPAGWQGQMHGTIHAQSIDDTESASAERPFVISAAGDGVTLAPFNLTFAEKTPLLLGATMDPANMTLRVSGTATPHQILFLRRMMPPLADGFDKAFPMLSTDAAGPIKVDLSCTRTWGGAQSCVAERVPETTKPRRRRASAPARDRAER